jgi:hypothetical protein
VEWLTHSLPSLRHDQGARDAAKTVVASLGAPADAAWTMARIAALLSPYYERDVPQAVRVMEAEDWAEALAEYPQWAIQNAVRWWKSEHNPDRRKRPMEGDIAARCNREVQPIKAARFILSRDIQPPPITATLQPDSRRPAQEERQAFAARVMAEVFDNKRKGPQ